MCKHRQKSVLIMLHESTYFLVAAVLLIYPLPTMMMILHMLTNIMYDVKVLEIKINIIVLATADRPVTQLEHERIRYMCVRTGRDSRYRVRAKSSWSTGVSNSLPH